MEQTKYTENTKAQMRKGTLEFAILLLIAKKEIYAGDIIKSLKKADLIVVEGTLYPLLSRLKREGLVDYAWRESKSGPPRKYYSITLKGTQTLAQLNATWTTLSTSLNSLMTSYEKNS